MKLFLILFCMLNTIQVFSQHYPSGKDEDRKRLRISVNGSLKMTNHISLSKAYETREITALSGLAAGIECFIASDADVTYAGAGFEYNFGSQAYGFNGSFQNFPVYLFYDMALLKIKYIALPNLHLQLGYNFLRLNKGFLADGAKSEGGVYYALGVSSRVSSRLSVRLLYSSNQGKVIDAGENYLFNNNRISLSLLIR